MKKWLGVASIYNLKFRHQLYICFAIVILLVIVLTMVSLYAMLWGNYTDSFIQSMEQQAWQVANNLDNKLESYVSSLDIILSDNNLTTALLEGDFDSAQQIFSKNSEQFVQSNTGRVHHLQLYQVSRRADVRPQQEDGLPTHIVNLFAFDSKVRYSGILFTSTYLNDRNEKVFSYYKRLYHPTQLYDYYVEMCVYETELYSFLNRTVPGNNISVWDEDRIVSSSNRSLMEESLRPQAHTSLAGHKATEEMWHLARANCKNGWQVSMDVSRNYITKDFVRTYQNVIYIGIIPLLLATLFVFQISHRLNLRIMMLQKKITLLSDWNFTQTIDLGGNDEFKYLSDELDRMSNQIWSLLNEINNTNKMKRVAEMKALRSQINSHFLFNTLSSIKWLSKSGEREIVGQAVEKLSEFLRYSLAIEENIVPLRDEISQLEAYFFLQKLRYADELYYQVDVDEELLEFPTVKIILQPLIENAIYHAKREGFPLNIVVCTYDDGEYYCLMVEDDGVGIAQEQIEGILSGRIVSKNSGYGLSNVLDRIRMCSYGTATVAIDSQLGSFTRITIRQPKILPEREQS